MSKLQTALERALPIVAAAYGDQFGVKVVLSGREAYTDGETIVLPLLDSMSELKDVLFGYLAHEAAHVRFSDFDILSKCQNQIEKSCTNIIEDVRIEQLIQDIFPGTQFTLDTSWEYMVDQGMCPPSKPEDNEATQLLQYLLHRLMFSVLNREASTSLSSVSKEVVEKTFPPGFFVRLDGVLGKHFDQLSTTEDSLKLAKAILKALQEAEEEESQQQNDQDGDDESSQDESGQSSGNSDSQTDGDSENNQSTELDSSDDSGTDGFQDTDSTEDTCDEGSDGSSLHERLLSESNLPEDPIEQLREQLVEQAQKDNHGEYISIETSSVGSDAYHDGEVDSLQNGILASSAIRSRLLGLLQAQTRQKEWLHHRGKRVDGKRITRFATGDTKVFVQREEVQRPDTAIHVLLDCSGSMSKIQEVANQATVSLALAISTIPKCNIAVSKFPGHDGKVSPILQRGHSVRANLGKFAACSDGGTPLAEAMMYAVRELANSHSHRKVLIIITDGSPNDVGAIHYLNSLIKGHIDTYSIGICSTAVSHFFENWSVINDVKELQNALFEIAGRFLDLH